MSRKPITHSRWLKGLQSGFDRYSQPKGSFSRVSNLVLTRRGALKVCDGSALITLYNGALQSLGANFGPITEVFLFQPIGGTTSYFGIVKDINAHFGPVVGVAASAGATGVLTGSYFYVVTGLDGAGGETTVSAEVSVTLSGQKGHITWTALVNSVGGYNVYRTPVGGASGTEQLVATVPGQATTSYDDNIPDSSLGANPPTINTTQVCQFYHFTAPAYSAGNIVKTLPADTLPIQPGNPIGGGGGGTGNNGGNPQTPYGGTSGNLSPIPMILQFKNDMILALGNGITPYTSDGTGGGTTQISNTFTAAYPAWIASTPYNQGDQIAVTISAVGYVFTAVQGGVSGSGTPSFSATLNSTVADNNILWKNSGQVTNSPPPRGASHAEVYAGSLWVANTGIVESSDQLDGPSALRMSGLNDPTSWNPLNAAQVSPDDGDQCTGIKAFTVAEAGIAPQNFLIFFKNFATYLIQGVFGASNFAITRLQTDLGCVSPRSIQFLPGYGIMRMTHLGFAVTDGINDKLQDPEAIRPYLFPESTEGDITPIDQSYLYFAKGAQTANPPMYVCAMPLQGSSSALAGAISIFAVYSNLSPITLSPGNYYFKVVGIDGNNKKFVSGEYPISVSAPTFPFPLYAKGITVQLPSNPNIVTWQIYVGSLPGAENQFIQVPGTTASVFLNNSTVYTNGVPPTSLGGNLSRIFCYDLILKAWTVVDLPFPISVLRQFRAPGTIPITLAAGFWDGALRRWQMGDQTWDAGATNANASINVQWAFTDAEVYAEAGTVRVFHNQVIIRGDGGPTSVSVTPSYNGSVQSTLRAILLALGNNQYEARSRLLTTAENLSLTVSGAGPATVESIDYESSPRPVGAALVIS